MKKVISIMLIMVVVFSLFGCASNENKIKNALVGTWGAQTQDGVKDKNIGWIFNADGTASLFAFGPVESGTYDIQQGKIVLTYESGDSATFIYSFDNGELKLKTEDSAWWNLWKQ